VRKLALVLFVVGFGLFPAAVFMGFMFAVPVSLLGLYWLYAERTK
jgi:hypothetical protein